MRDQEGDGTALTIWLEQGARVPIRVGFGDIGGVTGKYWANDEIWESGEGSVQDW
jgi:carbonyl reductase 1